MDDLALLLHEDRQKATSGLVKPGSPGKEKPLKTSELKVITLSLSRLLEGGVSLLNALEVMTENAAQPGLKSFLIKLRERIKQGCGFSEALKGMPGAVPPYFIHTLYAGEVSGTMPHVLQELGHYLEKEEILKRKIREALAYPAFILIMGLVTLGVLLHVVIPKLAVIYQDFGAELPLITRITLKLSHWAVPAFLVFGGGLGMISFFLKRHAAFWQTLAAKLPLAGRLSQPLALIQFSRLTALLLESGISILTALEIVAHTFSNPLLRKDLERIRDQISQGENLSRSLENITWIDPISRMLVISGEETGRLFSVFAQIAKDTEVRIESEIQILSKLLEPALILGVGVIVGAVVVATVLPIFDISGLMK